MNGCSPMMMAGPGQMGDMGMQAPLHVMTSMGPPAKVMVSLVSCHVVVKLDSFASILRTISGA